MGDLALKVTSNKPHPPPEEEAVILAKVKSRVTRYLAAQIIADPSFPNQKTIPQPSPPPFCNFGHQLLVDYERLLRIVWQVALEVRAEVLGRRLRRNALKWAPWITIIISIGIFTLSYYLDPLALISEPPLLTGTAVIMIWLSKAARADVANVRAKALQQLLEDRFKEDQNLFSVKRQRLGDGTLDGPEVPVLTITADEVPFPGFGVLHFDNLFVCAPKTPNSPRRVIDLARVIRDKVIAKSKEQTNTIIRNGELIAVHGGKLSIKSKWLGPDKVPILWFPRDELPYVQNVDKRASVRIFHATQMIFPQHATVATIFLRIFQAGNSIAFKLSVTTLGPPQEDRDDILIHLARHKLAKRKERRPREPSLDLSPMEQENLDHLHAELTKLALPSFQNDVEIEELAILDLHKDQTREAEYSRVLDRLVDTDPLWPGRDSVTSATLREQRSLPFLKDYFGRPESIAQIRSFYKQLVRCILEKIDEGGFDTSQYHQDTNTDSFATIPATETVHVPVSEFMRVERTIVHALVLTANPPETTRLRIDQEIRSIDEAIRRGRHRDRFELIAQLAVRKEDLQGHLLRYRPEILHFAGHGEVNGIILEDDQGGARALELEELRTLIELLGQRIRCVVLNACLTRPQAEMLAQHVPSVIGMSRAIDDPLAIEFAAGFYEALAYGESVKAAFELGSQRFAQSALRGPARDIMATIDAAPPANAPVLLGNTDPSEIRFF
jgi:hypothetical protein